MRTLPILLLVIVGVVYCYPLNEDNVDLESDVAEMEGAELDRVKRASDHKLEKKLDEIVSYYHI